MLAGKSQGQGTHTHSDIFLEVLLAADQMCDLGRHLMSDGTTIVLDPVLHFVEGALVTEITSDTNGESLERVSDHDDRTNACS